MGRCNGGGGRRHGGGGWQEGQNKGVKSGKTGHGRSGGHDAQVKAKREPQRFDKLGRPLNHGPWRNGYRIEGGNAGPDVERVGVGDAVAARLREAMSAGGGGEQAESGTSRSVIVGAVPSGDPIHALLRETAAAAAASGKDKAWGDFSAEERRAAEALGYTDSATWDSGEVRATWANLSPAQRDAAALLGYTRREWDADAAEAGLAPPPQQPPGGGQSRDIRATIAATAARISAQAASRAQAGVPPPQHPPIAPPHMMGGGGRGGGMSPMGAGWGGRGAGGCGGGGGAGRMEAELS
mmetsp:Transcript_19473/g.65716  ORF Transcript_19473/g.65716 Transcript_19473/m.65716 type:complete len:296 (+) Transcript_19473:102-989(+)